MRLRKKTCQHHSSHRDPRRALTVLELLVTMGLVTLIISLLLPAIHAARESARQTQCRNNLHQIGLAAHLHHDTFLRLPAGALQISGRPTAVGWIPRLLPFLEQAKLHQLVNSSWPDSSMLARSRPADLGSTDPETASSQVLQTPAFLSCPSDSALPTFLLFQETNKDEDIGEDASEGLLSDTVLMELPHTSYVGVSGSLDPDDLRERESDGTLICQRSFQFRDLTRGLSHVALVSERTARRLPSTWLGFHLEGEDAAARVVGFCSLGPNHPLADECEFDSRHPGCIQVLFADGHVQIVSDSIDG